MPSLTVPAVFAGLRKPHRYHVYYGGRGGGKTESIARVLISRAYTEQNLLVLCTREYQTSIRDSVHRVLAAIIWDSGLGPWFDIKEKSIVCKTTGSEFIFRGLHGNIGEIKSMHGVKVLWVEEAQSVIDESWLQLAPTIRANDSEIIVSFNPDSDLDPTYRRFVTHKPSNADVVKVGWRDNPYFPEVLETERRQMLEYDPDNYDWVWEGECRTITEAAVYHGKVVVRPFDDAPPKTHYYHGVDFGFSVDPTVMVRCWIKPSTDQPGKEDLMIDREAYSHHLEMDEMADFFKNSIDTARNWPIKADNARPETISYLSRQGLSISAAEKWQGSVEDGITHIRAFGKIVIHEHFCPNVAREFRLYSYKVDPRLRDSNGKAQVLPILLEKNDHGPDAVRYALDGLILSRGGIGVWRRLIGKK